MGLRAGRPPARPGDRRGSRKCPVPPLASWRAVATVTVVQRFQGRVFEEGALVKVGALAACGAFEPVAYELAAFDQRNYLRELAVGHFPQPVGGLVVVWRCRQQRLDLIERQARALPGL